MNRYKDIILKYNTVLCCDFRMHSMIDVRFSVDFKLEQL